MRTQVTPYLVIIDKKRVDPGQPNQRAVERRPPERLRKVIRLLGGTSAEGRCT